MNLCYDCKKPEIYCDCGEVRDREKELDEAIKRLDKQMGNY